MNKLEYIFLFGHRKQHFKNGSCSILESVLKGKGISSKQSYFAKILKQQVAVRYGLDFEQMESEEYKKSKPKHLGGLSVRDVLLKEGCFARSIWQNTWALPLYNELLLSDATVGMCSDFRFPNEYSCFDECFDLIDNRSSVSLRKPKVIKVLVHRPTGIFASDGADDQLPDIDPSYWDYTIMNDDVSENWIVNIEKQIKNMVKSVIGI